MKKRWTFLLALPLLLGTPTMMTSCGDDDPDPSGNPNNPETPSNPNQPGNGNTKLDSESQKQKLQKTAENFMNEVPANEFRNLSQLANYVNDQYLENDNYKNDVVTDWFEDVLNANVSFDKTGYESSYWREDYYKRIITLSQFKGKFVAEGKGWKKSDAKDLQFEFKDQNNQTCVLTVQTSGNVVKVYVGDTWDDDYQNSNGQWVEKIHENYVYVPEVITTSLTQGGNTLVSAKVEIDHSKFNGPEYDLTKDALSTKATATVNDFTWVVERASHNGTEGSAYVKASMSKAGKKLVALEASVADTKMNNDGDLLQGGAAKVSVDILGQVQIKGTCSNVKKFADYLEEADDNDENESMFKSYVNQANSLLDIGMYFDGGKTRQCKLRIDSFEDGYSSWKYWTYEPVLVFDDDSTYSTFTAFFNESSFRNVINMFEDLIRSYENLVDFVD